MSGTRIFEIGDKVRRIFGEFGGMKVGDTDVVVGINDIGLELEDFKGTHEYNYFELVEVEEAPIFNLKTQPWFIRVNNNKEESKLAQEWLFSQGVGWDSSQPVVVKGVVGSGGYLTKQQTDLVLQSHIMWGLS